MHLAAHFVLVDDVGVVGFEPTQSKTPDLQSGPALQLRRTPLDELAEFRCTKPTLDICFNKIQFVRSQQRDSNPRPADYKSAALPTELCWHIYIFRRFGLILKGFF